MSIDTFLEVPISIVPASNVGELTRLVADTGLWRVIEANYVDRIYELCGNRLPYIDLVEQLEDWSKLDEHYLLLLRAEAKNILDHSNLIESFQRICAMRTGKNSNSNMHLAIVVR
jgi:hypothetical protein